MVYHQNKNKNLAINAQKSEALRHLKIKELTVSRDLLGRLSYLALINSLNLESILTYPMMAVDLALGHIYGTPHTNDKAPLMKILEEYCQHGTPPDAITDVVVDAEFVL